MEKILINATQQDEIRVALVEGQTLYDLNREYPGSGPKKGDIFKAIITDIGINLEVVFVEYADNRQGFLPFANIAPEYLNGKLPEDFTRQALADHLKKGQELLVQIVKEERGLKERMGKKLAALTTYISLASPYLVLMPNKRGAGGISRRVEGDTRTEAKELRSSLELPEGMGLIIRTAGVDKTQEELQWDLAILLNYWQAIQAAYQETPAPSLIYQESDIIIRTIRDYLRKNITEIIIDNQTIYDKVQNYLKSIAIDFAPRIRLYNDSVPLFTRFQIESQIESAFRREVRLPSGGMIIIDQAEALTAIDVNSAGSKRRKSTSSGENSSEAHFQRVEETAFNTNMEAAKEIARQLRLRDIGGIVVIDFIDMKSRQNQREVENSLREALKMDKARTNVGRISQFGVLEMQRQRLRPSLVDTNQISCPRCQGQGVIRSVESLATFIVHLIEENALKEKTAEVRVQVPISVATYINNERRGQLVTLEQRYKISILIIANPHLETPQYKLERLREDETDDNEGNRQKSYLLVSKPEEEFISKNATAVDADITPAVKSLDLTNITPMPARKGLLSRLWNKLFGSSKQQKPAKKLANNQTHFKQRTPSRYGSSKRIDTVSSNSRRQSHNRRSRPKRNNWQGNDSGAPSQQTPTKTTTNKPLSNQQLAKIQQEEPVIKPLAIIEPSNTNVNASTQIEQAPIFTSVTQDTVVENQSASSHDSTIEDLSTQTMSDEQVSEQIKDRTDIAKQRSRQHNNRRRHHLRGNKNRARSTHKPQQATATDEIISPAATAETTTNEE